MDFSYLDSMFEEEGMAKEEETAVQAGDIWVLGEAQDGKLRPEVLPLICKARDMADTLGVSVAGVLIGSGVRGAAGEMFRYGADRVLLADDPALETYQPEAYAKVLADAVADRQPGSLLALAGDLGADLLPRLAQKLGTGLIAGCTELSADAAKRQLIGVYPLGDAGDVYYAAACPEARPQMVTLAPGALGMGFPSPRDEVVEDLAVDLDGVPQRLKWLGAAEPDLPPARVQDAAVIVAAGRGLQDAEGFALAQKLAGLLGGQVAGTRGALEAGWIGEDRLIGVAGAQVRPLLYVGCGVSGADHHLFGIQDARFIVAIDKNPDTPLMKHAHTAVVGDVKAVLSALVQELSG